MADIKNIKVGNTTYGLRDATALQNLTTAQETTILSNGTYNGEDVVNGTVFTTADGKFKEFGKEQDGLQTVTELFDYKRIFASTDKYFWFSNGYTYGYSSDGVNWSTANLGTLTYPKKVYAVFVNGNTVRVICRDNSFISTDDGATWSYDNGIAQNEYLKKQLYLDSGIYIICSAERSNVAFIYSSDAVNWSDGVSNLPESNRNITFFSDGDYVYLLGTTGNLYKSADCVSWSLVGVSTEVSTEFTNIDYHQGKFWKYESFDPNGSVNVFSSLKYSTDGLSWTAVPAITTSISDSYLKGAFKLYYCGNDTTGQFVLSVNYLQTGLQNQDSSDYYYVSSNGIDWQEKEFDDTFVASMGDNYTVFASTGTSFVLASASNSSYKGLANPTYTYSLTPLSYDKDEVDALISGGSSVAKETYTNPALTASGDICTWTVSHTLGTRDVIATVYDTTTYKEILAEVIHTDASTLTINITSSSDISAGTYKVVIIG